ncbi:hypothetical protein AWH48_14145 [Domibacillus aminovorans]|uniref:Uncharacterized protein n=2 Tax=Bacillales TaxID=1385 RepID=A0A177KIY1_9BACI|nr:hypothetical protein AWH48_14145 [Domibacillus aminovorans]
MFSPPFEVKEISQLRLDISFCRLVDNIIITLIIRKSISVYNDYKLGRQGHVTGSGLNWPSESDWKNKLLAGGMVATLTLDGLAGCAGGEDQDNGIDDGEVDDQLDLENNPQDEDKEQ